MLDIIFSLKNFLIKFSLVIWYRFHLVYGTVFNWYMVRFIFYIRIYLVTVDE